MKLLKNSYAFKLDSWLKCSHFPFSTHLVPLWQRRSQKRHAFWPQVWKRQNASFRSIKRAIRRKESNLWSYQLLEYFDFFGRASKNVHAKYFIWNRVEFRDNEDNGSTPWNQTDLNQISSRQSSLTFLMGTIAQESVEKNDIRAENLSCQLPPQHSNRIELSNLSTSLSEWKLET